MAENKDTRPSFSVEDADIIYKNFSGNKTQYNVAGARNFCVILPEREALQMEKDGWNVKTRTPREEGDDTIYYIQVKVNYDSKRPPRITLVSSAGKTPITADTVASLDFYEIRTVDVKAVAFAWESNTGSGITAYLDKMYVVIDEDDMDLKYAHLDG